MQHFAYVMFYFKENELLLKIKAYLLAHEKTESGYCVYG